MSRINLARSIRHLETKYGGNTTRFELEEWLRDQLLDTYLEVNEHDELDNNFKFEDIVIVFLPQQQLINLTRLDDEGKALECSISIKSFMLENYGISSLKDARTSIELTTFDFELIAMQITDSISEWGQYALILTRLGEWQKANGKRQESKDKRKNQDMS
jgi:hypothetical protein